MPLLEVTQLSVSLISSSGMPPQPLLRDLSFSIAAGETFALLGESGSGKSLTALTLMQLLPQNMHCDPAAEMRFDGLSLLALNQRQWCQLRGARIALVFQEPMTALNPVKTIAQQLREALPKPQRRQGDDCLEALLHQVELVDAARILAAYPHQLSGGQKQRIVIAMAIARKPQLLIADEPTTALDVVTQYQLLQLLKKIQQQQGIAILLISHDFQVVRHLAHRVGVMRAGELLEVGTLADFERQPQHPYSQHLLACLPQRYPQTAPARPPSSPESPNPPLLQVRDMSVAVTTKGEPAKTVLYRVSFAVSSGQTLALVGESGCGKTTLCKALLGWVPCTQGEVLWQGRSLPMAAQGVFPLQMVFQDPTMAMNPRWVAADIVLEGLRHRHQGLSRGEAQRRLRQLLDQVGLPQDSCYRYPHEFSGGQRQRLVIARALAVSPQLLLCDEPTSALDVSVQAQILNLFKTLQQELGLAYLFISHDLHVVRCIAQEVMVMRAGEVVEHGEVAQVLSQPQHSYTQALLSYA